MSEKNKKWLKYLLVAAVLYCIFFQFDLTIQKPILNILFVIYSLVGDFGVAIILLTVLVRLILWPMVSKQFKQQKKINAIQPQLAEIKKKTKGNKMLEATMMQELYKEHEIKPASSILTLIIQLPVFLAIFGIINCFSGVAEYTPNISQQIEETKAIVSVEGYEKGSNKEAETNLIKYQKIAKDYQYMQDSVYPVVRDIPRANEIVTNSTTFEPKLFNAIDLTKTATGGDWTILILAVLAAVFQYLQTKMTMPNKKNKRTLMGMFKEAAEGKEMSQAEIMQQSMGSMTKFFPIMTFIIAINFPGALVLYYAMTSLMAIAQQKIILRDLPEELEAAADKAGKNLSKIKEAEIVDTPKINKKTGTKIRRVTVEKPKKGGKKR
jgi:YidC/Oxa1 family membrane protein insertase